METPPRAWGRLRILVNNAAVDGNTPTCVGKTRPGIIDAKSGQKHPHVRGEDLGCRPRAPLYAETPPRAWGRPVRGPQEARSQRNTPTCVGKTALFEYMRAHGEKHPHVRGEDSYPGSEYCRMVETPPRAWGRHTRQPMITGKHRNTPTCVGKTKSACAHQNLH